MLNANSLRHHATALRARNPALYARMNGIRQSLLKGRSGVQAYQANAISAFLDLAQVEGARILEIGTDPGMTVLRRLIEAGATEAVGINNSREACRVKPGAGVDPSRARLIAGDASAMPFDEGSFDYVFSVATFEHILDLPAALAEMHRVLAPGGLLYTNFGPIWSGGKGHHLRVEVDGEELRHFMPEKNPLPDYVHLLLGPEELRASLAETLEERFVEPVVSWVYSDPGINRLFHHEYVRLFEASDFTLGRMRFESDRLDPQLRRVLELRHPGEAGFEVTNIEAVLMRGPA